MEIGKRRVVWSVTRTSVQKLRKSFFVVFRATEAKVMSKRNRACIWNCGRETKNTSRICDLCWADRDAIYQARKVREAAAEKKPRTAKQEAALDKARAAKLLKQLLTSELSEA